MISSYQKNPIRQKNGFLKEIAGGEGVIEELIQFDFHESLEHFS